MPHIIIIDNGSTKTTVEYRTEMVSTRSSKRKQHVSLPPTRRQNRQRKSNGIVSLLEKVNRNPSSLSSLIPQGYKKDGRFTSQGWLSGHIREQLKTIPVNQLPRVYHLIKAVIPQLYDSPNSEKQQYVSFNNVIKQRFGKDSNRHNEARGILRLSKAKKKKIDQEQKQKVKKKNINQRQFDINGDVLSTIINNIDSEDWARKAVALLLAGGNRLVGLLAKNTVTLANKPGHIKVTKLAKSRDPNKVCIRPVLQITPEAYIKELKNLRGQVSRLYKGRVLVKGKLNQAIEKVIADRVRRLFPHHTPIKPHDMRSWYANTAYHQKAPRTVSVSAYLSGVLGHNPDDLYTASSYQGWIPKIENTTSRVITSKSRLTPNISAVPVGRREIVELQAKLEELEKKCCTNPAPIPSRRFSDRTERSGASAPLPPLPKIPTKNSRKQEIMEIIADMIKSGEKVTVRTLREKARTSQKLAQTTLKEYREL